MPASEDGPSAEYLFRIRVRVESSDPDVRLSPNRFETTLSKAAAPPGEEGWLFFRKYLLRGTRPSWNARVPRFLTSASV